MKTCIKFLGVIILGIILLSACKEETLQYEKRKKKLFRG